MSAESCSTCRFFYCLGRWEICRRYPPQVYSDGNYNSESYPSVNSDGWCGEYQRVVTAEPCDFVKDEEVLK